MSGTHLRIPCVFALILLVAACGTSTAARTGRVTRNVLSEQEMQTAGYTDALTTVQSLRPQWLSKRGASSITQRETIKVYLDDSLLGGPEQLRQITISSIASIRYMDGLEATNRWGLDHGLGAIMVSTRRDAAPS